jgi:hypothetical protein
LAISGLSSGNLSITTNGTLDSAAGSAISAIIVNAGSTGNVTVVQNGIVTTGSHGIAASNLGSGATAVTVNGTVTSGGFGVSVIGQANTVTNYRDRRRHQFVRRDHGRQRRRDQRHAQCRHPDRRQ